MKVKKLEFVQNPYSNTLKTAKVNGLPDDIYYSISNDKDKYRFSASFVTNFNTCEKLGAYESFKEAEESCEEHFVALINSNLQ